MIMADEIDMTNERMEYDDKINRFKSIKKEPLVKIPTGSCLCCGRTIQNRRWCDVSCRDTFEKEKL